MKPLTCNYLATENSPMGHSFKAASPKGKLRVYNYDVTDSLNQMNVRPLAATLRQVD